MFWSGSVIAKTAASFRIAWKIAATCRYAIRKPKTAFGKSAVSDKLFMCAKISASLNASKLRATLPTNTLERSPSPFPLLSLQALHDLGKFPCCGFQPRQECQISVLGVRYQSFEHVHVMGAKQNSVAD